MSEFPNVQCSSVSQQDKGNGFTTYRLGFHRDEAVLLLEQFTAALEDKEGTGVMLHFSYGMTGKQQYPSGDAFFRTKLKPKEQQGGQGFKAKRFSGTSS